MFENKSWKIPKLKKKNDLYIKFDNIKKKFPVITLLQSIGLSSKKVFSMLRDKKISLKLILKEKNMTTEVALTKISNIILKKENNLLRLQKRIKINHIEVSKYYFKDHIIESSKNFKKNYL